MRKTFIFYILFCLILASILIVPNKNLVFADICSINSSGEYCLYAKSNYNFKNAKCINVGYGCIIKTNASNAKSIKREVENLQGESYCFKSSNKDIDKKIMQMFNATFVKFQNLDEAKIVYAYSNKLDKYIKEDGKKINLQISIDKGVVTVGYPIILGSY